MSKLAINAIEQRLNFYAQHGYNVLLEGRHGVGKTKIIEKTFDTMGWNYHVLNASTIDPYMDFIGVPTRQIDEKKAIEYLEMILPKQFAFDELDGLFLDEINRGRKETLNGLLDIIQNKSIKNKQLKRLKVIWAAQNPYFEDMDESEQIYNVKPLDPALKDRFHVFIDVPYQINKQYLKTKYGNLSKPFIEWWQELPEELSYSCSPRRLDYAIQIFSDGGVNYLSDVLDKKLPVSNLKTRIHETLTHQERDKLKLELNKVTVKEAVKIISLKNLTTVLDLIKNKEVKKEYLAAINPDYLENYLSKNNDSVLISLINELESENKLTTSNTLREVMNGHQQQSQYIVEKTLSKSINNQFSLNIDSQKNVAIGLLECVYQLYNKWGESVTGLTEFKLDAFFQYIKNSKQFNLLKQEIFNFQKEIVPLVMKKQKIKSTSIEEMKMVNQLNDSINMIYKKIFSTNINYAANLLFGYVFYQISQLYFKENVPSYSETLFHNYFSKVILDNKVLMNMFKKNKNLFLVLSLDMNLYIQETQNLITNLLNKGYNQYSDFERDSELNIAMYETLLEKINNCN